MDRKAERLNRCPDAQAMLPAYVEGELSEHERSRVEGHLNICSACRKEADDFRRALGVFKSEARQTSPTDLYYGFAAKLEAAENRGRRMIRRLRYAGAAACLLLVVGVSASPLVRYFTGKSSHQAAALSPVRPVIMHPSDQQVKMAQTTIQTESKVSPGPSVKDEASETSTNKPDSVSPEQTERSKETKVEPTKHQKPKKAIDTDFWHVRDQSGHTAAEAFERAASKSTLRANTGIDGGGLTPKDRMLRKEVGAIAPYTPDRFERVQVGGMETTIKTGYKLDEDGRKKGIHIEIGTSEK